MSSLLTPNITSGAVENVRAAVPVSHTLSNSQRENVSLRQRNKKCYHPSVCPLPIPPTVSRSNFFFGPTMNLWYRKTSPCTCNQYSAISFAHRHHLGCQTPVLSCSLSAHSILFLHISLLKMGPSTSMIGNLENSRWVTFPDHVHPSPPPHDGGPCVGLPLASTKYNSLDRNTRANRYRSSLVGSSSVC